MKIYRAFYMAAAVLLFFSGCREGKAEENEKNILSFRSIKYKTLVDGTITGWIKHEQGTARFRTDKLKEKDRFNSLRRPFWDLDGNTGFGGSWMLWLNINDSSEKNLMTSASYENTLDDDEALNFIFFIKDNEPPYNCTIEPGGRCGVRIEFMNQTRKGGVQIWATKGKATFNSLQPEKIGDHITGKIHATDEKHFDLTIKFDATIADIEKR